MLLVSRSKAGGERETRSTGSAVNSQGCRARGENKRCVPGVMWLMLVLVWVPLGGGSCVVVEMCAGGG